MAARVLVVDDILPNVKLLEAKLKAEFYDVLTATSGQDALDMLEKVIPDIVLLDVMMPGMDGFEVCQRIKENPKTAHVPVVMVTALTDTTDRVRGLQSGADDFLSKPLNDIALLARVRSLVRLKMTVDEWRARESTASQLGMTEEDQSVMTQPVEGANILVIEDQSFESDKFVDTLQVDNDNVTVVTSGAEAMKLITEKDFDLMAVSLNLKNEDGLRLSSYIRSTERTRSVPILMIGTDDDMQRIAHGLEIGAHDYILRPVDRNELLARVRTQIRRKRFQEKLRATYEISLSLALVDSLTGLYNRRYFETHLQKLLAKSKEDGKKFGLLIMDIDRFKDINDTHGHTVGDEILKIYGERLQYNIRGFDMVARFGGEEFVVLLPDVSQETAYHVGERLRRAISDTPFVCNVADGQLTVTASIGGAIIEPGDYSVAEVLDRADKALYEAKESGRNATFFEHVGRIDPEKYKEEERKVV